MALVNSVKFAQIRSMIVVKILFILFFIGMINVVSAQNDTVWNQKPVINFSGFLDLFYVYDFNQPEKAERQPFLFNHNRHNEFNLNLGIIKLGLDHTKYRANFGLHSGTYSQDNYAAEPGLLKNIYEANIGISLNGKNNLWIDAGIMPSHIGFESAISMDNWTLTRSILAENSPYFLSGVKLSFLPNEKWELAGLIMNGWQRIQRLEGNSLQSFGTQVIFRPTESTNLNWSTFFGTDDPDQTRRMRYFNNFYGQFQLTKNFGLIAGFDLGIQQQIINSPKYDFWFSPVLIGKAKLNQNWSTAMRLEYYQDRSAILIPIETINGFRTAGISFNLDYSPASSIICRIEVRGMKSKDAIFESKTNQSTSNFIIGSSIAIRL